MALDREEVAALVLEMLPPFIIVPLADDIAFSSAFGVSLTRVATIAGVDVERDELLASVRLAMSAPGTEIEFLDTEGGAHTVVADPGDPLKLRAKIGDWKGELDGYFGLHPAPDVRVRGFEAACFAAGLLSDQLQEWRDLLAQRQLSAEEVQSLAQTLRETPEALALRFSSSSGRKSFAPNFLVPEAAVYFERLIGGGEAADLEAFAETVVAPRVAELLKWRRPEGARRALLVGGHWLLLHESALNQLPDDELAELLGWARDAGDPISKVAAVEIALSRVSASPSFVPLIDALARQIAGLAPGDESGILQLTSAAFILTEAELSRTRSLSRWPPFRRRAASLAHAAFLAQTLPSMIEIKSFCRQVFDQAGEGFYLQNLLDLRVEPRWYPENISPQSIKDELIGRLYNAAGRLGGNLPEDLRGIFFDPDVPEGVAANFRVPQCLEAGPLEGALRTAPQIEDGELLKILDESLDAEGFEPRTLAALINIQSMYRLSKDRFERVVELIRRKGYRFETVRDEGERDSVIMGLARVAASGRSPELANSVRLMCRARRDEKTGSVQAHHELLIALTAAAAHEEADSWAEFIGNWAWELAYGLDDKHQGAAYLRTLDHALQIEPLLRVKCSGARAAAAAYLAAEGALFEA
jgi:acetolactate synthase regulatory subunit